MALPVSRDGVGAALLRWLEDPDAPANEMAVDMLQLELSKAVVGSGRSLRRGTAVLLLQGGQTEQGNVQSCQADGKKFIVTIHLHADRDPGATAVDSFLSEADEQRILEEIAAEMDPGGTQRGLAKLLNFTAFWSRLSTNRA